MLKLDVQVLFGASMMPMYFHPNELIVSLVLEMTYNVLSGTLSLYTTK